MRRETRLVAALLLALVLSAGTAQARAITWVRAEDALTLDPHAVNDGVTQALQHQIYEPLLIRDGQGKSVPALAESWSLTSDPQVWEFKLRQGVTFHDGSPFTADDVVFSLNRARQPNSDMKSTLASIDTVGKLDPFTVRIKTRGANPLLPASLTNLFIMSKAWSEKHRTARVQNFRTKEENFAARQANGTGPFILVSREPEKSTVMVRNSTYWGKNAAPLEITELVYRPIKQDSQRVAALVSGEADFVQDVPVQDLQRLSNTQGVVVNVGAENRSIFLGLNVGGDELASSNVKGRNPFAEKKVRHAMRMAINRQAIQRNVMYGQSLPTGIIAPPMVNGYTRQLDQIPPYDVAKAKTLIEEAGYPGGFSVQLDCPIDRYVNDLAICQAVAAQLKQIGIDINLVGAPRTEYFALIRHTPPETDFYLMGFVVPTLDSEYLFSQLFHSRGDLRGAWNATRNANPDLDKMIAGLGRETDLVKRNQAIAQIWRMVQEESIYIPLHIQTLAYAMKNDLDIPVDLENKPKLKYVRFKRSQ